MIFLELTDDDSRDLALELFYAGDAATLDQAAALATDMQAVLTDCAEAWDFDAECLAIATDAMLMPEGDLLDTNGMRV